MLPYHQQHKKKKWLRSLHGAGVGESFERLGFEFCVHCYPESTSKERVARLADDRQQLEQAARTLQVQ